MKREAVVDVTFDWLSPGEAASVFVKYVKLATTLRATATKNIWIPWAHLKRQIAALIILRTTNHPLQNFWFVDIGMGVMERCARVTEIEEEV